MDPDENLREQLLIAEQLVRGTVYDEGVSCDRLAELVLALNQWITRGGFLPSDWQKAQRKNYDKEG